MSKNEGMEKRGVVQTPAEKTAHDKAAKDLRLPGKDVKHPTKTTPKQRK